ncbi:hypothetical protein GCWU000342_00713 [Shuttleworthella satelles DSM 14600]|uniref:Uncharacterized protein n=1 Tax=Shuttleworthella satelles DSM 14600 TaxID=626523 RepID=C4G9Q9_9FIRM|nr:hypothetical protein GCWU000342_00713 [Shuttleworthia satelles DSM 14600]
MLSMLFPVMNQNAAAGRMRSGRGIFTDMECHGGHMLRFAIVESAWIM